MAIVLSVSLRFTLLVTPLVSCDHCVFCPSSAYGFWLPLWYLGHCVVCPSSVYGFWLHLWYIGHCVVCPSSAYGFWLPLWYLVAIALSVLLRFTASDYPFGILAIVVSVLLRLTASDYPFGILAIVVSVLLRLTASDYPFGILWPLYCLSFGLRLLITPLVSCGLVLSVLRFTLLVTPLVSCGHCVVCPSVYGFWLPLWYLVAIVLSVLRFTLLITTLVSCGHCVVCPSVYDFWLPLWYLVAIVLSVFLRFTASDYHFGYLWPLCCLSFFGLRLLITTLISCGHCVVCPSVYGFWLPLWYLVAIVLSVLRFTASDYHFGILWPFCCLSFFGLRLLITPLVSWPLCCRSFFGLRLLITPLVYCGHCVVCPSVYGFWLPIWYLVAVVLSVLLRFMASDYPFGILWPLYCLSFFGLRLLITTLVSWPFCCRSFFGLRLLITPLVSCGHCIVCPSVYGFWLPLWYLLAVVLSVLLRLRLLITP